MSAVVAFQVVIKDFFYPRSSSLLQSTYCCIYLYSAIHPDGLSVNALLISPSYRSWYPLALSSTPTLAAFHGMALIHTYTHIQIYIYVVHISEDSCPSLSSPEAPLSAWGAFRQRPLSRPQYPPPLSQPRCLEYTGCYRPHRRCPRSCRPSHGSAGANGHRRARRRRAC